MVLPAPEYFSWRGLWEQARSIGVTSMDAVEIGVDLTKSSQQ